jgi:hypothetical protein
MDAVYGFGIGLVCRTSLSAWQKVVILGNFEKQSRRLRTHGREIVSQEISKAGVKVLIYYAKIVLLAWRNANIMNKFDGLILQAQQADTRCNQLAHHESVMQQKLAVHLLTAESRMHEVVELTENVSLGVDAFGNELGHNSTILSDLENEVKLLEGYLNARNGSSRGSSRQSPIDQREFRHTRDFLATV